MLGKGRTAMSRFAAPEAGRRESKYRNVRTVVDGITLDSKKEAARYIQLRDMEAREDITGLTVHERFPIVVNGEHICYYEADFTYYEHVHHVPPNGRKVRRDTPIRVVEDVKGVRTDVYRIKKALMLACHGIEVREL